MIAKSDAKVDRRGWKGWGIFLVLSILLTACLPTGLRMQENPLLRTLERKSGLIVYVGADGNIYTMDQGGGRQKAVTSDAQTSPGEDSQVRFYQFPSWSPDGSRLAFVRITGLGGAVDKVSLLTAGPDGSELVETFGSEEQYPFYLYWSPDSTRLSFLTTSPADSVLSLHVVPARGGDSRLLDSGGPFYWSWSPDKNSIVLHSGGAAKVEPDARLTVMDLEGEMFEEPLDLKPTFFQAPAWSPSGDEMILAAETGEGKEALLLTNERGRVIKELATVEGAVAFGWSPDGKNLAYITTENQEGQDSARKLTVLKLDQPEQAKLASEDIPLAFFWSPDSKRLAYFTPVMSAPTPEPGGAAAEPTFLLSLNIYELASEKTIQVSTFLPSSDFINLLPFFDQYQYSSTIWSPDSRRLVLSAVNEEGEKGVYVVEASANLQPRFLTTGDLAFWSWR
jgi:Tol biopolymer transport system component